MRSYLANMRRSSEYYILVRLIFSLRPGLRLALRKKKKKYMFEFVPFFPGGPILLFLFFYEEAVYLRGSANGA